MTKLQSSDLSSGTQSSLTFGLLIDWISSPYHVALWRGIADYAAQHNINLIVFPGREIKSPYYFEAQANVIYDVIDAQYLDGLIITSDSLADHITAAEMVAFCQQFSPLPMVGIASIIGDMPSVLIENTLGMRELLIHMIEVHQCQKIAFISGPEENFDALQRFEVYKDVLEAYGIPFDADLVEPGFFRIEGGMEATEALLDRNEILPDVIVAADDTMAMGSLTILNNRGLNVPVDVALVGFDDEPGSKHLLPPLTTVRQPFYEQGYRSAELLMAQIKDMVAENIVELAPYLVVRQSCGCHSKSASQAIIDLHMHQISVENDMGGVIQELIDKEQEIILQMQQAILIVDDQTNLHCQQLFRALLAELAREVPQIFIRTLNTVLQETIKARGDMLVWQSAISVLRHTIISLTNDAEILLHAENLWHQARILIGEASERKQAYRRVKSMQQAQLLRQVSEGLIATFDMAMMLDGLADDLPRLGITHGYLTMYEEPKQSIEFGRLLLAFNHEGKITLPEGGVRYSTKELIPRPYFKLDTVYHLIALPLYFKTEQLGFVIFSVKEPDEITYDTLRGQLSSAVQGAVLMEKVQHHAKNLEDEVKRQTTDLKDANEKLKLYALDLEAANGKLQQRNQDLRDFAYISSHDLQEPLRKIQLFSTLVETKYVEILDDSGQHYLQRISGTAGQIQTMIHDLYTFAQVLFENQSYMQVDLAAVIDAVSHDLKTLTTETNGRIVWGELPKVEAVPTLMYQLFHHLLSNGLKFHRATVPPLIQIDSVIVTERNSQSDGIDYCEIRVVDNGIGFEEKYGERIFSVFRRLHNRSKYEGTGVGLAVCRKIVEQHNGRISATSIKGQGSTFIVRIPLKNQNGHLH